MTVMTSPSLAGKTVVVTGAGRGLGRAIAVAAAQAGADAVALVARSADQLGDAGADVKAAGAEAHPFTADLGDLAGIEALARGIREALGRIDVLINNAATVDPLGPTERLDPAAVLAALAVNVAAPITLTARLLPELTAAGGEVVNVSSGAAAGPAGMIGGGTYAATKAALEAHTLNLAAELDGTGVVANIYRPGVVDTSMQQWLRSRDSAEVGERLTEQFTRYHEEGRLVTPEASAAQLIGHLGSGRTGQVWTFAG